MGAEGQQGGERSKVDLAAHQMAVNALTSDGNGASRFEKEAAAKWPNMSTDPKQALEYRIGHARTLRDAERFAEARTEFETAIREADESGDVTLAGKLGEELADLRDYEIN